MESERDYLSRRAREEQDAAEHAPSDKLRELHMEFAARYRDAADSNLPRKELELVASTALPKEFRIIE